MEEYLAHLPRLYDAAEPATKKRLLQALFERVEMWLMPSAEAEARGLGVLFTGEFRTKVRQSGRGERSRIFTIQVFVQIVGGVAPAFVSRTVETA